MVTRCPVCGCEHESVKVWETEIIPCPEIPENYVLMVDPKKFENCIVLKNVGKPEED